MYDASAKVPRTGLISGHQHFPGNFESCLEVAAKEFTGKHCLNIGLPDASILTPGQMDAWEHFKSSNTKIFTCSSHFNFQMCIISCRCILAREEFKDLYNFCRMDLSY